MATAIYYYTGTGNSLWIARLLARELGDAEVYPMTQRAKDAPPLEADAVGLVFPVHSWGLPRAVVGFLDELSRTAYHFACAVNGGQVSRTLVQRAASWSVGACRCPEASRPGPELYHPDSA